MAALWFYPEGTTVLPKDNELRTLHKIAALVASGGGGGGGLAFSTGVGSPEGVVTGSPGDTYWQTDGGFEYTKVTGTATNTGWRVH